MAEPDDAPTVAGRLALAQRAGGVAGPVLTAAFALLIGGLVVLATGANPLSTYRAIFDGSGLNWLFPWVTGDARSFAATNLQQTLLLTTALILCGLAVSVGFRCGLFNIGGQGQYIVGSIFALWVGSSFLPMNGPLHIVLTIVVATLAGAAYAGIAGLLKALTGAHEVISTIMLNWIAVWVGSWLVGQGGALQSHANGGATPISNAVASSTHLHVFWGNPALQGLDVGFFFALAGLVVYCAPAQPHDARVRAARGRLQSGGGALRRYRRGADVRHDDGDRGRLCRPRGRDRRARVGVPARGDDIQTSQIGFIAIAVAVLGRNRAVGVFFSALLFGALLTGTSTRNLDATVFRPDLAGNLTLDHPGPRRSLCRRGRAHLWLWSRRRGDCEWRRDLEAGDPRGRARVLACAAAGRAVGDRRTARAWSAAVGCGAWTVAKGGRRPGLYAIAAGVLGAVLGVLAAHAGRGNLDAAVVWSALISLMLVNATPLTYAAIGGLFSERSGVVNIGLEGMMLTGAFFGIWGSGRHRQLGARPAHRDRGRRALALVYAFFAIHLRTDQIIGGTAINFLALGVTGYLFVDIYGTLGTPALRGSQQIPDITISRSSSFFAQAFGQLNLMIWLSFVVLALTYVVVFRTPLGLRLRSVGEHPRAADAVGISVYKTRYARGRPVRDAVRNGRGLSLNRIRALVQ